ncbi:RNA polymerase ECF-type sigma factor [Fictibacillus macauensis ZFHKF-1]|uniref:RNA polymerase ECF-type sigma factor n=1 Tax=Fictibacillus macauensis ZFHKF-1 TaxID=1196324 RepID=I8UBK0_9BACL|nr:sigma-70 family RNA polymerase sigma factor [Fictibacillus macauensis]EIT84315.1 RNA polymerase ECF-type sigma factor [Fictibacillus macauensis ZFHKF-1]
MGRISDEELYELVQADNKEALEQLYDRYEKLLFSFSYKIVNTSDLAEEAIQDVFMKLWRKKGIYTADKGKFSSFLLTVTRNTCLDLLRKQSKNQVELLDKDLEREQTESTEETVTWNEERQRLQEAVSTLSSEQQEIVQLFYFKGCSQATIAEKKDLPLGTVKGRIRLALQHLRKVYEERGDRIGT